MNYLIVYVIIFSMTIALFLVTGKNNRDILNPVVFFNVWTFIEIVPRVIEIGNGNYTDSEWLRYFVIQIMAVVFTNLGMYFYLKSSNRRMKLVFITNENSDKKLLKFAVITFLIGIGSKIYLLNKFGGLIYVISHLQIRTQLLAGNGYVNTLGSLISIGIVCSLKCYYNKKLQIGKTPIGRLILFIGMLIIGGGYLIVFGARAPILELIMALVFLRHYTFKKIKIKEIFRPQSVIIIAFVFLFMAMMPLLRYSETSTIYKTPTKWIQTALSSSSSSIFNEISTVDRDMFTFEHFSTNSKWYGMVYLNIIFQPIPSTIYLNKPPMDDGRYLYNLKKGFNVGPNTANSDIPLQTSVPFSSEGILYANFGYIGIVLGSALIGVLYQFVYRLLKDSNYLVFMIIAYQLVIYQFRVSTLHSLSTLILIMYMYIFYKIFLGFKVSLVRTGS